MERLRQKPLEINPIGVVKKTAHLEREYPLFKEKTERVILNNFSGNSLVSEVIQKHFGPEYRYGPQYTEMGYCTKAFADMICPTSDNTDIGICATEFYLFLDILDDAIDDPSKIFIEKAKMLTQARNLFSQKDTHCNTEEIQIMASLVQDMLQRVRNFSNSSDGVVAFANRSLETFDALYKEVHSSTSEKRALITTAHVGRSCAYPLMELISGKFGASLPFKTVGNLVAIGNILDDYWDIIKDKNSNKQTFLTVDLPDKEMNNIEIILRSLRDIQTHQMAFAYGSKLFFQAMSPLEKEQQEEVLAVALFAQIGVLKRRYFSIKNHFEPFWSLVQNSH